MIIVIFLTMLLGLLVGKIRLGTVQFGLAGVLFVALLFGFLQNEFLHFKDEFDENILSFVSSLGTALFISSIGLTAGNTLDATGTRHRKAFIAGAAVVLIGVVATIVFSKILYWLPKEMIQGVFSGSMTSTPALSATRELYIDDSLVVIGYSSSYVVGLLGIMLFVQMHSFVKVDSNTMAKKEGSQKTTLDPLYLILPVGVLGFLLAEFLPIGSTGSILLVSALIGWLCRKRAVTIADMTLYQNFGLMLFLVGAGLPAGAHLSYELLVSGLPLAIFVSGSAIFFGYYLIRRFIRLDVGDTLSVLCGGMTSTPAIGVLQTRVAIIDLTLYTASYIGALVALLVSVQVLQIIL